MGSRCRRHGGGSALPSIARQRQAIETEAEMNPIHIEMLSRSREFGSPQAAQQREQNLLRYRAELDAAGRQRRLRLARAAWNLLKRRPGAGRTRPADPVTAPEAVLP
jgi:hypothetical protein